MASHERPTVQLAQGTIKGLVLKDRLPRSVEAFRGIPYAVPPVGDLRFRPALKIPPAPEALVNATQYGPSAFGKPLFANGPKLEYSEDCLTVNVFRHQAVQQGALLPVVLYVHGGAFNRGTASMHDTASMVAWSEEPKKEGALNLGLKDQILLFEWVQDNIQAFGGDPNNITLIGLSAGAHSIGHHLMNYNGQRAPLFHRVVMESGAPTSRAVRPHDAPIHEQQFREFLQEAGVPAGIPEDEIFLLLRKLPVEAISKAQTTVFGAYDASLRWAFQPVIDEEIIPRPPIQSWTSGRWHKVPIMTGFARNEGSIYVDKSMSEPHQFTSFFSRLLPLLSEEDISTIADLYPDPSSNKDSVYKDSRKGVGTQFKRIEAAYGNYAYAAPVRQTADLASKDNVPVYLYHWAFETLFIEGARHGGHLPYEACSADIMEASSGQSLLARTIHAYITSFVISGDPNVVNQGLPDRPHWKPYRGKQPGAMVFGANNKELVGGASGPPAHFEDDRWMKEESEFWWQKVELSQQ